MRTACNRCTVSAAPASAAAMRSRSLRTALFPAAAAACEGYTMFALLHPH